MLIGESCLKMLNFCSSVNEAKKSDFGQNDEMIPAIHGANDIDNRDEVDKIVILLKDGRRLVFHVGHGTDLFAVRVLKRVYPITSHGS